MQITIGIEKYRRVVIKKEMYPTGNILDIDEK